ncbi:hypothetical protein UFOVP747_27 [uncultured Caudovirales phage]|uniref:Uncharacterized protein n=1 Tax=uncultured Caudovirales phage TaxID=2100421 RepID=A0A6J7X3C1_9CAUD|nr:hypothetical protein UFOVP675_3 [uncultured Caudovirales phage]CAB5225425.1 hypothetical protein UFOVP747_27 [uncultured Caudovirales phage]
MKRTKLLALLSVMALLAGCAMGLSERPCPRVTDFPPAMQAAAAAEIEGRPNITRIMDAMAADRAFNRRICA